MLTDVVPACRPSIRLFGPVAAVVKVAVQKKRFAWRDQSQYGLGSAVPATRRALTIAKESRAALAPSMISSNGSAPDLSVDQTKRLRARAFPAGDSGIPNPDHQRGLTHRFTEPHKNYERTIKVLLLSISVSGLALLSGCENMDVPTRNTGIGRPAEPSSSGVSHQWKSPKVLRLALQPVGQVATVIPKRPRTMGMRNNSIGRCRRKVRYVLARRPTSVGQGRGKLIFKPKIRCYRCPNLLSHSQNGAPPLLK